MLRAQARLGGGTLLAGRARCECIATVIILVTGVTFCPDPFRPVPGHLLVQCLPQVLVDDRLSGGSHPSLALPPVDPRRNAVLQVFGIGDDFNFTAFAECTQTPDGSSQFHAVVGRVRLTAPQFFLVIAVAENRRPPAGTRIAEAGAIGYEPYLLQCASTASEL